MELSIASHGNASLFANLTKEMKEFKKGHHQEKIKRGGSPKSIFKGGEATSNLEGVRGKTKKVIDLPESKRPEEINKEKSSLTRMKQQSLTPIEVDFPRKSLEGSLEIDNHEENEVVGWTLVSHKKRRHQTFLRIRLPKTRAIRNDVNQLQPPKSVKPCTRQKINGSLSQKDLFGNNISIAY
ncbi:hypothetical protein KY285_007766 [Solanum tuberosum]|nr:hypothetical protein KY285_007766 [Solanum tuberosum]